MRIEFQIMSYNGWVEQRDCFNVPDEILAQYVDLEVVRSLDGIVTSLFNPKEYDEGFYTAMDLERLFDLAEPSAYSNLAYDQKRVSPFNPDNHGALNHWRASLKLTIGSVQEITDVNPFDPDVLITGIV